MINTIVMSAILGPGSVNMALVCKRDKPTCMALIYSHNDYVLVLDPYAMKRGGISARRLKKTGASVPYNLRDNVTYDEFNMVLGECIGAPYTDPLFNTAPTTGKTRYTASTVEAINDVDVNTAMEFCNVAHKRIQEQLNIKPFDVHQRERELEKENRELINKIKLKSRSWRRRQKEKNRTY